MSEIVTSENDADPNNNLKSLLLLRKAIERLDDKEVEDVLRRGFEVGNKHVDDQHYHTALHALVITYTESHRRLPQANVRFVDIMSRLLHHGVDINSKDISRKTALHFAVTKPGNSDIVKVLVSSGADVTCVDRLSQTALHKAVTSASQYEVKALLDGGADPNALDMSGHSALHLACKRQHNSSVIDLLLKSGAKMNLHESGGLSPLHLACRYGHLDSVVLLLQGGARVDITDSSGQTCLHMAAAHDVTGQIIPRLVEHHADVHAHDHLFEDTPLHKAVKHQMLENIKGLMKARANPNIPDCHQDSVLHLAAATLKDIHCWTLLMKSGASMHAKNKDHQSPLDKALRARNTVAVNVMHQFDIVASPKLQPSPRLSHRTINQALGF